MSQPCEAELEKSELTACDYSIEILLEIINVSATLS